MTPNVLNRVCARPVLICWIVGALISDVIMLTVPSDGVRLISVASDPRGCLVLILAVIGATGLGLYVGMFTCWFWIRPLCCQLNGAPFKIGDRALIMAGRLRGTVAEVEDITQGQGGQDVVWLDLGPERGKKFSNIFEEFSLMKIKNGEPGGAPNIRRPSQSPSSPEVRSPDSPRTSFSGGCG